LLDLGVRVELVAKELGDEVFDVGLELFVCQVGDGVEAEGSAATRVPYGVVVSEIHELVDEVGPVSE